MGNFKLRVQTQASGDALACDRRSRPFSSSDKYCICIQLCSTMVKKSSIGLITESEHEETDRSTDLLATGSDPHWQLTYYTVIRFHSSYHSAPPRNTSHHPSFPSKYATKLTVLGNFASRRLKFFPT